MSEKPLSHFPVPELDDLPEDVRARIEDVHEKAGFIPNVFVVLSHRPAEFRAFFAYHDALMEKEGGLSKAEREMIVVVTSAVNRCPYCIVAHGALVRIYGKTPLLADQLAANYLSADITTRQRALLDFAVKITERSHEVSTHDFDALHAEGFDDEDIWDIAAIAAFFGLSNRMAALTGMWPNPEFYLLGRLPRRAPENGGSGDDS